MESLVIRRRELRWRWALTLPSHSARVRTRGQHLQGQVAHCLIHIPVGEAHGAADTGAGAIEREIVK